MDDGAVRVLTRSVQGARELDLPRAAAVIRSVAPDVVALQEVQRRQASALAVALSLTSRRWVVEHRPAVTGAEGLAVLGRHPMVPTACPLRRRPFWDRRRPSRLDARLAVGERRIGVLAAPGPHVVAGDVVVAPGRLDELAELSDHLPCDATVVLPDGTGAGPR